MPGTRNAQRALAAPPLLLGLAALSALLLLPACYGRQPILSDPPGERVAAPAAQAQPVAVQPEQPTPSAPAAQSIQEPAAQPVAEPAQQSPAAQAPAKAAVVQEYYVQTGAFATEKNADGAVAWLKEKGYSQTRIVRVEQGQATYHRVQAGPFQSYVPARKALDELKPFWPQAFIPGD